MADDAMVDVLSSTQPLNISCEGGEFEAITTLYHSMKQKYVYGTFAK